jgi:hypothetical protein
MSNIGNKWKLVSSLMTLGSLGCGSASPREVKATWQKIRGVKSNAKSTVDVVTTVPRGGRDNAIRDGMLVGINKALKRLEACDKKMLEHRVLAWNDPENGFSDDVNEGVVRPFTTALGTLKQLPSCDDDSPEYRSAVEELKNFANENSLHIQNGSANGLRVHSKCPYTSETVGSYMDFLEKGCQLMSEVIRFAPAQS